MMDRSQGHVIADDGFILVEAADARTKGMVTSMFQEWCLSWVQFLTALQILCLAASSLSPMRGEVIIHFSVKVRVLGQAAELFGVSDCGYFVVPCMLCHTKGSVK